MHTVIRDRELAEELIADRRARGADQHDEVWEGVYMMSPLADDEHQELVGEITAVLIEAIKRPGLGKVRPGVNVSDRRREWKSNYRAPDVVVRLKQGVAEILGTFWLGGPDFLVEIVSPDDQTYDKLPFYESIGTREVFVVDRKPWALVLYRLTDGKLLEAGRSSVDNGNVLTSEVVPLSFRLLPGQARPQIEVTHTASDQRWVI
jgi:Uma2 family endonuclease